MGLGWRRSQSGHRKGQCEWGGIRLDLPAQSLWPGRPAVTSPAMSESDSEWRHACAGAHARLAYSTYFSRPATTALLASPCPGGSAARRLPPDGPQFFSLKTGSSRRRRRSAALRAPRHPPAGGGTQTSPQRPHDSDGIPRPSPRHGDASPRHVLVASESSSRRHGPCARRGSWVRCRRGRQAARRGRALRLCRRGDWRRGRRGGGGVCSGGALHLACRPGLKGGWVGWGGGIWSVGGPGD